MAKFKIQVTGDHDVRVPATSVATVSGVATCVECGDRVNVQGSGTVGQTIELTGQDRNGHTVVVTTVAK